MDCWRVQRRPDWDCHFEKRNRMDIHYSEKLLDLLIGNTRRILQEGFGITPAEHSMIAVLELLENEPALKAAFLKRVGETLHKPNAWGLDEGNVPRELIELSAHHFRWPEFVDLAERRLKELFGGDKWLAASDVFTTLTAALEADWEDLEFYEVYNRRTDSVVNS